MIPMIPYEHLGIKRNDFFLEEKIKFLFINLTYIVEIDYILTLVSLLLKFLEIRDKTDLKVDTVLLV